MLFIEDAAVVVRGEDGQVKLDQATNLVSTGAVGGGFWRLLIGALFRAPWMGLAVGAVVGAFAGKILDIGLDDDFYRRCKQRCGSRQLSTVHVGQRCNQGTCNQRA